MNPDNIKKFPISINKHQCIGPCFPGKFELFNPLTIEIGKSMDPTCPTIPWVDENNLSNSFDECQDPIDIEEARKIKRKYIIPIVNFNCEYFLKTYYDIFSFEEAIEWLVNNDPIYTKLRIMDCTWKIYGLNADITNDIILDFYGLVFKKVWINKIYKKIYKYLYVDENKIYFKENNLQLDEYKVERVNFLNEQFNTSDIIYNVLSSYIDSNQDNWNDIKNHNDSIRKHYTKYIEDKISKIIK